MYVVKYIEDGVEKTSSEFESREEAFGFQAKILCGRKRNAEGVWVTDTIGVYRLA